MCHSNSTYFFKYLNGLVNDPESIFFTRLYGVMLIPA